MEGEREERDAREWRERRAVKVGNDWEKGGKVG